MDIISKLRYIQEGFSIEQINSGNISPFGSIKETTFSFPEYLSINTEYISESSLELLQESSSILDHVRKFFKWIMDKVIQFVTWIKDRFQSKKTGMVSKFDADLQRAKEQYERIKKANDDMESAKYEVTSFSNVLADDKIRFSEYIKDVYSVFDQRVKKVIGLTGTDENIVLFTDIAIDDESKFIDSVFMEAMKVRNNTDEITSKIFGERKTIYVQLNDMDRIRAKIDYLQSERDRTASFVEIHIKGKLKEYESLIDKNIVEGIAKRDGAKNFRNYKVANEESAKLEMIKRKLGELGKIYNYLFKATTHIITVIDGVINNLLESMSHVVVKMVDVTLAATNSI